MRLLISFLVISSSAVCFAKLNVKAKKVYQSNSVVWSFSFINHSEMIISHRNGKLVYYNQKTGKKTPLVAPKSEVDGQGGLLDVHYYPVGDKNYVYLTYSEKVGKVVTTSLARGVFKNKSLVDLKTLFRAKIFGDSSIHFGSRLVFKDKHIFMTVGDRGERDYAQKLGFHNGKILRLTLEGKPATGNPFIGNPKALPEIWSYGHRNPQGIGISPTDNSVYSCEFGPRGGDELNIIKRANNYGWPVITYGSEYWGPKIGDTHKEGMEQPLTYWVPSISPSGMAFYSGNKIKEWSGDLFLANLSSKHLRRLVIRKQKVVKQEVLFNELEERIRHVRTGVDGYLYFSTDSGKIYKVTKIVSSKGE